MKNKKEIERHREAECHFSLGSNWDWEKKKFCTQHLGVGFCEWKSAAFGACV